MLKLHIKAFKIEQKSITKITHSKSVDLKMWNDYNQLLFILILYIIYLLTSVMLNRRHLVISVNHHNTVKLMHSFLHIH